MILRPANEADCAAMAAIYAPYVNETDVSWEYEAPDAAEMQTRLREHVAAGYPWLVAEEEGRVIGYAYAGRFAARRGYDWDAELTVYLDRAERGRGAGSALYAALLSCLRRQGVVNAYALVTSPNEASDAFHTALGFTRAALLPACGYKCGHWVGLSYYHVALAPHEEVPAPFVPFSPEQVAEHLRQRRLDGAPRTVLETERLILRETTQADFRALCGMLCDDAVMTAYGGAFDHAMVQDWLNRQCARYDKYGFGLWLAFEKETGRCAGQLGVTVQEWPEHGEVLETGWMLRADMQHRGYATEGARACADYARKALGADAVYAIIRDTNLPSRRVAGRLGMTERGRFVKHYRGEVMPHIVYAV